MKKTFVWCILALLLWSMILPFGAAAADLDPSVKGSMTLHYTKDGTVFPELELSVYRIGQIHVDGTFDLVEPYSAYPVSIQGITTQQEWRDVTQTLTGYIAADQIQPDHITHTDENGAAVLADLESGIYLIRSVKVELNSGIYLFEDFLVVLPRQQEDGSYDYDVEAYPKSSHSAPTDTYSVIKLWKDEGRETARTEFITVDILKDGVLYETVQLSPENDWHYTWTTTDTAAVWQVVERDVPEGYTVSVTQRETTFTVVNTATDTPDNPPDDPPETGDLLNPWLYVMLMCLSGLVLLLMAVWRR